MRTFWKGALSFGLVNIPVKLYPATAHEDLKFTYLHSVCHTPLNYRRVCPHCEAEVTAEETVRGFAYEPGQYVIVTAEELAALPVKSLHAIEITGFTSQDQLDPVYFEKSYYLAPQPGGAKAYRLLLAAMAKSGRLALAKVTLRAKEALAAVRAAGPALILTTMYYPEEVRPVAEVPDLAQAAGAEPPSERELAMADQLIAQLATDFVPGEYQDRYRAALLALVETKVAGAATVAAPVPGRSAEVVDLMAALQASLSRSGPEPPAARPNALPKTNPAATPDAVPGKPRRKVPTGAVAGRTVRRRRG